MTDNKKGLGGMIEDAIGMDDDKGKGWHGDPKGHAKAGKKGGQASSQNRQDEETEVESKE